MKNLADYEIDDLDNLPNEKFPRERRGYIDTDYPWKKVQSFLQSRVGTIWDLVISEFVHKEWVPVRFRLPSKLAESVEANTFLKDGKVYFHDKYNNWKYNDWRKGNDRAIEDEQKETFYVHPQTRLLSVFRPQKKKSYLTTKQEKQNSILRVIGNYHQLIKVKGVWFEIKGNPVESDIVVIDGLHYKKIKGIPTDYDRKYYKVLDGVCLVPTTGNTSIGYRYSKERIGPKDPMVKTELDTETTYSGRFDFDSVKVFLYRQLSHKELKKHNLFNDPPKIIGTHCKVCGGYNCVQMHHNYRCSKCGEKWCRTHAVYPGTYAS